MADGKNTGKALILILSQIPDDNSSCHAEIKKNVLSVRHR